MVEGFEQAMIDPGEAVIRVRHGGNGLPNTAPLTTITPASISVSFPLPSGPSPSLQEGKDECHLLRDRENRTTREQERQDHKRPTRNEQFDQHNLERPPGKPHQLSIHPHSASAWLTRCPPYP